jgi:hypothetical protein
MKPDKLRLDKSKGLWLNKEAITKLQETQLANIKGGSDVSLSCLAASCVASCNANSCNSKAAVAE